MKPPWSLSVLGNFSVKTQNCQLQIAVEPDPGLRGLMLFASPRATNMSLLTKKGNAGNAFSDVNQRKRKGLERYELKTNCNVKKKDNQQPGGYFHQLIHLTFAERRFHCSRNLKKEHRNISCKHPSSWSPRAVCNVMAYCELP